MQIRKIQLCHLQSEQDSDVQEFVASIKNHGFAILNTDGVEEQAAMLRTLHEAERMRTFRFPSHSEEPHYTEDQRASFKGLFKWGQTCLRTLLNHLDLDGRSSSVCTYMTWYLYVVYMVYHILYGIWYTGIPIVNPLNLLKIQNCDVVTKPILSHHG